MQRYGCGKPSPKKRKDDVDNPTIKERNKVYEKKRKQSFLQGWSIGMQAIRRHSLINYIRSSIKPVKNSDF